MAENLPPETRLPSERTLDSGLILDIDRHAVRATMFDTVEGHGRFITGAVTTSTMNPPVSDVSLAVRTVIQKLEAETGRFLLAENRILSPSDGFHGIDNVSLTGIPVRPTRLSIIPTGAHWLTTSLLSVARTTTTIVRLLDGSIRTDDSILSGTLLEGELLSFDPDVIVLLAGNRTQSEWTIAIGVIGDLMRGSLAPQVVILASEQLQQHALQLLGEDANLIGLDPNLYEPAEVTGAVEIELQGVYEQRLKSFDLGASSSAQQYVSRGRARDLVTRFIARRRKQVVVLADISDGMSVHQARQRDGWMTVRPEYDLRRNATSILDLDLNRIQHSLPFDYTLEDLRHWILNRALRPAMMATLPRDQVIESVLATETIRAVWSDCPSEQKSQTALIVGGVTFSAWDQPMLGVLSLLDAFEPKPASGLVEVVLDADDIAGSAGAIGELNPSLAADAVENDLFLNTMSVVIVDGLGEVGELAIRGSVSYDNGEFCQFSVLSGSMYRVPTDNANIQSMTLVCESGYSIGGSSPGEKVEFGSTRPLQQNLIDVVIDARCARLRQSDNSLNRRDVVASWFKSLDIRY